MKKTNAQNREYGHFIAIQLVARKNYGEVRCLKHINPVFHTGYACFSANEHRTSSKIKHREKGLWQRRYWEHQIRDEIDLQRHVDYIHYNPVKHGHVKQAKDWPHSTFHKYVAQGVYTENWGGFDDNGAFGE